MSRGIECAAAIIGEVKKAVIGKDECIIKAMAAILAGGHILIEDIPGVGKTTLALAFAKSMGMTQKRVQFTPDVLPADLTGFSMYDPQQKEFRYQPGAVLCNLFLADEINRTSPKTQSALLEVMEEGTVTVDGRDTGSSETIPCDRNAEPDWISRNTAAAGVTAGSFYDFYDNGVSGYCR